MTEDLDFSKYAAALGRIRTPKKTAASRRNIAKATASLDAASRHERAKKAAAARWKDHKKNK